MLNETQGQPNPFQYEGGYFESSTGLVKFGTRYYNPNLGRWTQQDPVGGSLGNADTLNRYLYVDDDPVNEVDPGGTDTLADCIISVIVTLVGMAGTAFDGFWAGIALLEAAATGAALSTLALISWILFPILALAGAIAFVLVMNDCLGSSYPVF